jgi:hypothetical protein
MITAEVHSDVNRARTEVSRIARAFGSEERRENRFGVSTR